MATRLSLTVPKGWSPVDLDRVFSEAIPDLMISVLGDELDGETQGALHEEFRRVREEVRRDQIAFMSLRQAEDDGPRDVMTVAVHGLGGAPPPGPAASPTPRHASETVGGETAERVSVEGREAIVHVASAHVADSTDPGVAGSWAQVVVLLSSEEGAAVTLTSSAAGREDELRAEAIEVAGSLALVPDAPVGA